MKRQLVVEVAGQQITLRTDADEEYVRRLASFVSEKVAVAKTGSRTVSAHLLALLTAMNITADLFEERERSRELRREVAARAQQILERIAEVKKKR